MDLPVSPRAAVDFRLPDPIMTAVEPTYQSIGSEKPPMTRIRTAILLALLAGVVAPAPPAEDPDTVYPIDITGAPYRGPRDARVTIVEFSDYQ